VRVLENLVVAVILVVKHGFVKEAIAAVEYVVGGVNGPEPYNAVPIPNLRLVDYLHPFQRKPKGSYTVEFPHLEMSATYPVRSYAALASKILAVSSPLPVSFCLLQP
jgi:hypothetical protein